MDFIYRAFGAMLKFFNDITGHYAIALILYALVFKIVFLPFAIKQQKNQVKMAKLTPKIELIKAKYRGRNDPVTQRKLQQEIMELQQKEGYSPLSGCLPLLLQFPVIIWLYKVIRMPLTYIMKWTDEEVVDFFKKIPEAAQDITFDKIDQIKLISDIKANGLYDAELLPNFDMFGKSLGIEPTFTTWLIVIPLLAAGFQWFHMWLTRKLNGNANALVGQDAQTAASMKIMDVVMPLMTFFIAYNFSAMMGLYWVYQSIFAIIQSIILAKIMPLPRYTQEQLKQMKKEQKAVEKAQREIMKSNPKFRSLHYIDEDDYDTLPTVKKKDGDEKKKTPPPSSGDLPEIKD